jgi:hypothetical protein
MFHLRNNVRIWLPAVVAAALVALGAVRLEYGGGSSVDSASDYEDCVDRVHAQGPGDEASGSLAACDARFAGRRKADGGYTYYDFMQDRKFDIKGPNPSAEEHKAIDREYIVYLEAQRREAISAALAKRQNDLLRADVESSSQPPGAPLALTPANVPLPVPRRVAERREKARQCAEDALMCGLSKLSSVVKDAFASSPKTKN